METTTELLRLLDDTLGLNGRALSFDEHTPLLGALPELDSMAVVALINALEDQLGVSVADDEISGDTFATVASLSSFVSAKLAG